MPKKYAPNLGQVDMNRAKQIFTLYVLEQVLGVTQRVLDRRLVRAYNYTAHVCVDNMGTKSFEFVNQLELKKLEIKAKLILESFFVKPIC